MPQLEACWVTVGPGHSISKAGLLVSPGHLRPARLIGLLLPTAARGRAPHGFCAKAGGVSVGPDFWALENMCCYLPLTRQRN